MSTEIALSDLNTAPADTLRTQLLALCSCPAWAAQVIEQRPYADRAALIDASDAAFADLTPQDLDDALAGHPRIGDRVEAAGHSADLSRSEQSQMGSAAADVRDQIRDENLAYEQRFDRVFLIRAAGRAPGEILDELERRLANSPEAELAEVREQLRQITRLRLEGFIQ